MDTHDRWSTTEHEDEEVDGEERERERDDVNGGNVERVWKGEIDVSGS